MTLPVPTGPQIPPDQQWQVTPPVPGQGGAGTPLVQQAVAVLQPPDQARPLGSQDVYQVIPQTAVGPGPGAVSAPLGRLVIPPLMVCRLATFGVQVLNMAAASLITWRLRVNGQPAGPWGNLTIPAAPVVVAARDFDIYVFTGEKAIIDVVMQVDDVAAYTLQAFFAGWTYPLATHLAYYGASQYLLGR